MQVVLTVILTILIVSSTICFAHYVNTCGNAFVKLKDITKCCTLIPIDSADSTRFLLQYRGLSYRNASVTVHAMLKTFRLEDQDDENILMTASKSSWDAMVSRNEIIMKNSNVNFIEGKYEDINFDRKFEIDFETIRIMME